MQMALYPPWGGAAAQGRDGFSEAACVLGYGIISLWCSIAWLRGELHLGIHTCRLRGTIIQRREKQLSALDTREDRVYNPKCHEMELIVTKRIKMPQEHDMTTPKMTRVTVRVPKTTLDQINGWVDTLGVRRSHFLGIALVAGARSLIQASALEMSLAQASDSHPGTSLAAKEPATDLAPTDGGTIAQTIEKLRAEIVSLQSEVADLKNQLQTQQVTAKKRA